MRKMTQTLENTLQGFRLEWETIVKKSEVNLFGLRARIQSSTNKYTLRNECVIIRRLLQIITVIIKTRVKL